MSGGRASRTGVAGLVLASLALACEPAPVASTGGVELDEVKNASGESCGSGLAVIQTDYASTNVAILGLDGSTLSGSILSSGSEGVKLNAPLGGDVVLPSSLDASELVLIDRYPNAVLTFLNLATGRVRGQLDVGTGFASNPQDYLALSDSVALVSRYDSNPNPDATIEERGDDILIVDPKNLEVTGVVDLDAVRAPAPFLTRPARLARVRDRVLVTLAGYDGRFQDAAPARLAWLDAGARRAVSSVEIDGMKNCAGLAVSPSGAEIALSCSGLVDGSDEADPSDSGIVVFSVEGSSEEAPRLREKARFWAADFARGPFSFSLSYASDETLVVGTYGAVEGPDAGRPDRVFSLEIADGTTHDWIESEKDPFTLGEIRCVTPCDVCFVADAGRGDVARFSSIRSAAPVLERWTIEETIGLPPRQLGHL